jgi:hypothetical protein
MLHAFMQPVDVELSLVAVAQADVTFDPVAPPSVLTNPSAAGEQQEVGSKSNTSWLDPSVD